MAKPQLILIEFNELCPSLLDKWMGEGLLPNFKRFYDDSQVFVTEADETDPATLEPWIQWYSVHTGRPYQDHKVFRLTEGPSADYKDLWSILNHSGLAVMNFGSMNAKSFTYPGSLYFADPWCTTEAAWPDRLQPAQDFVQQAVQESTRRAHGNSPREALRALYAMGANGLSGRTAFMIVNHLFHEKISGARALEATNSFGLDSARYFPQIL